MRETKTLINKWILTYKPTKTDTEISKHPPRHIGPESERDENPCKYIDSDIQSNNDRLRDRQTPAQTHKRRK